MGDGDIGQFPACGMCGRPVHPHSMGIRYRGNVQCHGESTCISVLEQEVSQWRDLALRAADELERCGWRDGDGMEVPDNRWTVIEAIRAASTSLADSTQTPAASPAKK